MSIDSKDCSESEEEQPVTNRRKTVFEVLTLKKPSKNANMNESDNTYSFQNITDVKQEVTKKAKVAHKKFHGYMKKAQGWLGFS